MFISQENKNYIYHHPDVNIGFRLLSAFAKLLEMQAGYLGWDRLQESVGGIGINSGEQEALILIAVGSLTIIGNVWVDMRANASVSAETTPPIIIEKDSDPGDLYVSSLKHFASQHPELSVDEALELMIKDWDSESQRRDINNFREALNWIRDNSDNWMKKVEINNPYAEAGYDTYHTNVIGFQAAADQLFGGDLDATLTHVLNPETQPQSEENIRLANESYRWLKNQRVLKE